MAKSYADLWKEVGGLEAEGKAVSEAKANAAKLPYTLKEEFRKAQDPKLDQAINKAQSDTFGAAIKGLNMYQDISNPFARRDLAEQYQGGIEMGWKNLTDERTRRQGVYADYIEKWSGLYGAEAAKRADEFNNKMSIWEKEKSLADTEENNRRWNIENARAERAANAKNDKPYTEQEITSTINTLKNKGVDWGTIASFLGEKGIDVNHNSFADKQLRGAFGQPTDDVDQLKEEQLKKIKSENAIVENYNKKITAPDVYEQDGKYYKKRGLFGFTNILDYLYPDKEIK